MPLYEYQCEKCGDIFEVMQKFADEPLTAHEKCGGQVHRLISAPAFQFKGSGWYITDYAKNSGGKETKETKSNGNTSGADSAPAKSEKSDKTPSASTSSTSSSDKT